MASLPKILVQEEEELAKAYKDHHDALASIYNNAGENVLFFFKNFYSIKLATSSLHFKFNSITIFDQEIILETVFLVIYSSTCFFLNLILGPHDNEKLTFLPLI